MPGGGAASGGGNYYSSSFSGQVGDPYGSGGTVSAYDVGGTNAYGNPLGTGRGSGGGSSASSAFMFAGAASQLITTFGDMYQAKVSADIKRYAGEVQAKIFETNSIIAKLRAEDAINRGRTKGIKAKQAAKLLIGKQRAITGAQNVEIDTGSALDVTMETAAIGAEEELMINNNAWREAWGYRVEAEDARAQAAYTRLASKAEARNTILTGGVTAAKSFATYAYRSQRDSTIYDFLTAGGS